MCFAKYRLYVLFVIKLSYYTTMALACPRSGIGPARAHGYRTRQGMQKLMHQRAPRRRPAASFPDRRQSERRRRSCTGRTARDGL